ncbi:MAG: tRNA (adenosine(37)-N6)-threonylcarbamoyltransferase complex ATPase subunit type 1 TsaE [Candidatus Omnitrophota bacterium]
MITFTTNSPEETMRLGKQICRRLPLNIVIALSGDLGCGKTTFVKGMAQALGIDPKKVNSPSYVLIKEYNVKEGNLFHLDLYRLDGVKEISMLGIEEYFTQKGLLVIEWAEKAKDLMPDEYIQIKIKALSEYRRTLSFSTKGKKYNNLLNSFQRKITG